jgi:hypothetical protein
MFPGRNLEAAGAVMTYTVVWLGPAQGHLATIWTEGPDRGAITKAANSIERLLGHNPFANSESRAGNSRIMILSPLAVSYDVSEDDRLVTVWAVWKVTK